MALDAAGALVGTVTFCRAGSPWAEVARPGEAEFRMLGVARAGRGLGTGTALVLACLDRAREAGDRALVLSTFADGRGAHALYDRLGFARLPERDWAPRPEVPLAVYARDLGAVQQAAAGAVGGAA